MIIEVGEDLREEFNRKFENCTTQVRCRSREQGGNRDTHFRWSKSVAPFEFLCALGGPPPSTPAPATSSSLTVREMLGTGRVSMVNGLDWNGSSSYRWPAIQRVLKGYDDWRVVADTPFRAAFDLE